VFTFVLPFLGDVPSPWGANIVAGHTGYNWKFTILSSHTDPKALAIWRQTDTRIGNLGKKPGSQRDVEGVIPGKAIRHYRRNPFADSSVGVL